MKKPAPGRSILFAFMAGQVRRWHTKPHISRPQDLAQHTFGVAVIISLLHPDPSAKLLKAALHHDLPEAMTGDIERWAKQRTPELSQMMHGLEEAVARHHHLTFDLDAEDQRWLHGADLLEAWMFLLQNLIAGNAMMQGHLNMATRELQDGWKAGRYPDEIMVASDQIRAMYPWVRIY